jgi:hypothetical protein
MGVVPSVPVRGCVKTAQRKLGGDQYWTGSQQAMCGRQKHRLAVASTLLWLKFSQAEKRSQRADFEFSHSLVTKPSFTGYQGIGNLGQRFLPFIAAR